LLQKLRALEPLDGVGHVRGKGLIAAVEVVADKATKQLFPPEAQVTQRLYEALLERGLYTRVLMDCICLAPPLIISDEQIDRIVEVIRETIPAVLSDVPKR
ncbi:MAG TPA: aminotransferase class III-fold pyridoxal phosphate-dependent enzyme, partial [Anaerolineales bacterium]|nr:aminotransferase class III-fold pyridoxal phosphate-dependent enzyme [Anaerolineales bacterium]